MQSKESKLLRRIAQYEDVIKQINKLLNTAVDEKKEELEALLKKAEENLEKERINWNKFIIKERTPKEILCRYQSM